MSVSHRQLTPSSSASLFVALCLSVNPCILQASLGFSSSTPRVPSVKNINSVLYGWLDARSKFLLFLTPAPTLFSCLSLKNTSNQWFSTGHKHGRTQTAAAPCVTCLVRGNQGCLTAELKAYIFVVLFLFSSCLNPGHIKFWLRPWVWKSRSWGTCLCSIKYTF